MDNAEIIFYPWGQQAYEDCLPPKTAEKELAPYWKDLPNYHGGEKDLEKVHNKTVRRDNVWLSLKHCMPYFDAMTMGYHIILHTDVFVNRNHNGNIDVKWDHILHPIAQRSVEEMPTPHGHYNNHLSWQMYWGIKTPDGYSALITHPINRYDLPFTTVSGYVDYDVYPMPGNISFHIKDNFEGVIPKGTPIASIIPIKRDIWSSKLNTDPAFFEKMLEYAKEKETVPMAHYKKGYRIGVEYK
jgi:hypothetical protein